MKVTNNTTKNQSRLSLENKCDFQKQIALPQESNKEFRVERVEVQQDHLPNTADLEPDTFFRVVLQCKETQSMRQLNVEFQMHSGCNEEQRDEFAVKMPQIDIIIDKNDVVAAKHHGLYPRQQVPVLRFRNCLFRSVFELLSYFSFPLFFLDYDWWYK